MTRRSHEWRDQAACAEVDPELHFPNAHAEHQHTHARAVCARCPVRTPCLTLALQEEGDCSIDHRHGIYGGLTPAERHALTTGKPAPPPKKTRRRLEEDPHTEAELLQAHRLHAAGDRTPRVVDGERAYQRNRKRAARKADAA